MSVLNRNTCLVLNIHSTNMYLNTKIRLFAHSTGRRQYLKIEGSGIKIGNIYMVSCEEKGANAVTRKCLSEQLQKGSK